MRKFASKLLSSERRTGEAKNRSAHQDATARSGEESILSARERLDGPVVSSFRIHSEEIEFTSTSSHGRGGKADVAQAKLKRTGGSDEQLVAVKKLRDIETKARKEFIREVEVMAGLSHKNTVQLIGFVEDLEKGVAWIVLSWAPNGNVRDFLNKADWEIPERISLIQDTFEGIQYLHTRQPPIYHGDLKSLNILVNFSCRAILSDFGSAREVNGPEDGVTGDEGGQQIRQGPTAEQASSPIQVDATGNQLTLTGPAWTLRWAPPEVVKGERPGLSSDIWAAGWVCWEVMTNNIPFDKLKCDLSVASSVIRGEVPSPQDHKQLAPIAALCSLMTACWAFDPKARPDISQCCKELKWMPSAPPSSRDPSGFRAPSVQLLLQKGQIEFRRASYEEAASLFQQGLSLATSEDNQAWAAIALRLLGDTYRSQAKYSQAEESYTRARQIFTDIGDDKNCAMTMGSIGRLSILRSEFTQAEQMYIQAKEIYTRLSDEQGQAISMSGLGEVYRRQSNYTQGEEFHKRAQEIYARVGDENGRANTLRGLGDIYRFQSKYPQAEESYKGAHDLYARLGHDFGRAATLDGLGQTYLSQSKLLQAEESVTQAQEIYVRLGEDSEQAGMLVRLGEICTVQSKYAQAEDLYTQAQKIYISLSEEYGQGNALDGLATVYRLQSKYTQAEEVFGRTQAVYARVGDERNQANTLLGLGDLYRDQSKYIQAEEMYTRAQEIYVRLGNDYGRANTLSGLGEIYRHLPKYAQAEESYILALEIYTRLGAVLGQANMLCCMGHLRRLQGCNGEAATFYTEARDLATRIGQPNWVERVSSWLALVLPEQNLSVTSP